MLTFERHLRVAAAIKAVLNLEDIPKIEDIDVIEHPPDEKEYYYTFTTSDGVPFGVTFTDYGRDYWEVEFWPEKQGDVAESPIETLKSVASIIREFIDDKRPSHLGFIGLSSKHDKVYLKMLQRLLPEGSWKVSGGQATMSLDQVGERELQASKVAVLQEIPEVESHEQDVAWNTGPVGRDRVRKFFQTSDGSMYRVSFSQRGPIGTTGEPSGSWDVSFGTASVDPAYNQPPVRGAPFQPSEKFPESKKPVEVLGKVAGAVRQFVNENHPSALTFFGTSESREKVYQAMLKRFVPGQWEYDGEDFVLVLDAEAWAVEKEAWDEYHEQVAQRVGLYT